MNRIESASQKDYYELVEVWEASVQATHHFIPEEYIQYIKSLLNKFLDMVALKCIRNEAKKIIGFSGTADGKIEMLFVHPDWFGKSLILHALHHQNATEVDVNEQNEQAVEFYQHMGFEVIGRSETDGLGKPFPLLHMRYKNFEEEGS